MKLAQLDKLDNFMNLYVIIPAFNEETSIGSVILSLKRSGYDNILVINDGSTDKTERIALESGASVLSHLINRGQGAALRTGIEYLRENYDPDIIVTFDADGQHCPEYINTLVYPLLVNDFDIVLGSRFIDKNNQSNIPFLRKIILKAGIIFTNTLSNINLTDTHNGFRALGRKAIDSIQISQRGMEHASEIIEEIKKKKLKYTEVPVQITYSEYSRCKGQKNYNFIKLGLKVILKKIIEKTC